MSFSTVAAKAPSGMGVPMQAWAVSSPTSAADAASVGRTIPHRDMRAVDTAGSLRAFRDSGAARGEPCGVETTCVRTPDASASLERQDEEPVDDVEELMMVLFVEASRRLSYHREIQ
jgi:hypothetical protein